MRTFVVFFVVVLGKKPLPTPLPPPNRCQQPQLLPTTTLLFSPFPPPFFFYFFFSVFLFFVPFFFFLPPCSFGKKQMFSPGRVLTTSPPSSPTPTRSRNSPRSPLAGSSRWGPASPQQVPTSPSFSEGSAVRQNSLLKSRVSRPASPTRSGSGSYLASPRMHTSRMSPRFLPSAGGQTSPKSPLSSLPNPRMSHLELQKPDEAQNPNLSLLHRFFLCIVSWSKNKDHFFFELLF